jgi:hypothetical protein
MIYPILVCAEAEDRNRMIGKGGSSQVFPISACYYCITLQLQPVAANPKHFILGNIIMCM